METRCAFQYDARHYQVAVSRWLQNGTFAEAFSLFPQY